MAQHFMNIVLSLRMLYVVVSCLQIPLSTKLVNLNSHLSQLLAVISLVYLTEPTFPQQTQQLVLANQRPRLRSHSN
jgi:hypothetical protein